jgi:RHS repeat-associated protein
LPCSADDPEYLFSAIYYDNRGRVIQQKSTNSLGGTESEYILLDFTGKAQARRHVHTAPSKASVTEEYSYEYDHAGRLLSTDYRLNGGSSVTLSSNEYDALGRLSSTQQGSGISTGYAYNVRSWLTSINSGQLFSERLYYNESRGRGSTPDYRGNISSMEWQAGGGSRRSYDFIYDYHSRLKQASYAEGGVQNGHYDTYYSYDNMGNMLSLRRSGLQDGGEYGVIDDVTFTYNGNRLIRAEDDADDPTYSGAFNFRDGEDETVEYEYDANGNLISDLNKGISSVSYNLLNLPEKVTVSNGSYERFIYSADGKKLQTSSYTFSGRRYLSPRKPPQRPKVKLKTTTYCGNIIYEDGALSQILFDGGYATLDDDGIPQYHFYLRDHLGNNRVVARADGTIEQVNHYYPFGGLMGESTGGDEQRYKYNGKELDRMHGLDWFDYGARMYDGLRFTTMDPLAEKYYNVSPYVYCTNNPVKYVDPDGRTVNLITGGGGAFIGGCISGYMAYCEGKSPKEILGAAVEGAIVGGVTGLTLGVSTSVTGWTIAGNMAAGALSSGAGNAANQLISNGEINSDGIVKSTVTGAISGAIGSVGGKMVNKSGEKAIGAIRTKADNTIANAKNIASSRVEQTGAKMGGKYAKQQVNRETGKIIKDVQATTSSAVQTTKTITTGKNWTVQMGIGAITNKVSEYYKSAKKTLKSIYKSIF